MSRGREPKSNGQDFDIVIRDSEIVDKPVDSLPYPRHWEIIVDAAAWREIYAHARADLRRERGGILLGEIYEYGDRKAVRVTGAVPARLAVGSAASLHFNYEAWQEIERNRPQNGEKLIGWYHTHPGLTAFYSETDYFSHQNFFNLPWQIGLV